MLTEDVNATSPDGRVTINIAQRTFVLGPDGKRLDEIVVTPVDPLPTPPEGYHVIAAFDFEPDDATFDPGINITIGYDPDTLPGRVNEANLAIASRNETTGEWVFMTGVVDTDTNTVTFSIDHFTVFAMLAADVPIPTPTPTPTATPTPTPTPAPGLSTAAWTIIGEALLVFIALILVWFLIGLRRRRKQTDWMNE